MSSSGSNSAIVLEMAEEFLERYRQGQRPSLKEYIDKHPHLAAEIKEVFPAMAMMENIALADESLAGKGLTGHGFEAPLALERLGDYRIIREVGRGGMGVVYEAEQVSLGRHVALKVLPNKALADDRQKLRFEREAKAAAKLHHTNIVPVFGVGEHDGLPYYVMQFIQGLGMNEVLEELKHIQGKGVPAATGELPISRRNQSAAEVARSLLTGHHAPTPLPVGERVRSEGNLTVDQPTVLGDGRDEPARNDAANAPFQGVPADAPKSGSLSASSVVLPGQSDDSMRPGKRTYWQSIANIGSQVAAALDYAHHQGILHRDIKPSNLLLDTRGTVWVTDFGLAKTEDQQNLTTTGDILGTLRYMPPEAFEGKSDRRGDIYALGLTLYELLAMRPAYGEKDRHRLIKQVTNTEPARLDAVNPAIPRDLVTIVHKAIDRDPAHRYPTAGELAADLRRYLDDEPIHARRLSGLERCGRWCRRNPLVASLTAAIVLLTVLGFGATVHQMRAAEDHAGQATKNAEQATKNADEREIQRQEAIAAHEKLKKKEAELRAALSGITFSQIQAAWDGQNIVKVRQLLQQLKPAPGEADDRGWEWRYFDRLCHADVKTVMLDDRITNGIFSPDGSRLMSQAAASMVGQASASVAFFDTATGKTIRYLPVDGVPRIETTTGNQVLTRVNRDGTRLAVADRGPKGKKDGPGPTRYLKVFDVANGKELFKTQIDPTDNAEISFSDRMSFSPAGDRVTWDPGDGKLKIWTIGGNTEPLTITANFAISVGSKVFGPQGDRFAAVVGNSIVVWDAATGKQLAEFPIPTFKQFAENPNGPGGALYNLRFSPNGQQIAAVGGGGPGSLKSKEEGKPTNFIVILDAKSGKELQRILMSSAVAAPGYQHIRYSRDGKLLAGFTKAIGQGPDKVQPVQVVWIWDAASGVQTRTLRGHTDSIVDVAPAATEQGFLSMALDGTIKEWDASGTDELRRETMQGFERFADAEKIAKGGGFRFGGKKGSGSGPILGPPLTVNGECNVMAIWQWMLVPSLTATLRTHPEALISGTVGLLASPQGGSTFLAGSTLSYGISSGFGPIQGRTKTKRPIREIGIWDFKGRQLLVYDQHIGPVQHVTLSSDGTLAASVAKLADAFGAGELRLWNTSTGKTHFVVAYPANNSTQFVDYVSPKGGPKNVKKQITTFELRTSPIRMPLPAFSPDGRRLAISALQSEGDKLRYVVKVLDTATGAELAATGVLEFEIKGLQFSPDGAGLVGIGPGSEVMAWDAATGKKRWSIAMPGRDSVHVAFNGDGTRLVVAVSGAVPKKGAAEVFDREIRVVDFATGKAVLKLPSPYADLYTGLPPVLSRDGKWLAVLSHPLGLGNADVQVEVWDVARGERRWTLEGHRDAYFMAFTPDCRRLATCDSTAKAEVKLWDLVTGHQVLALPTHKRAFGLQFSADGHRLAVLGNGETTFATLWDATPVGERK